MSEKVLVIGGAGMIGSWVVKILLNKGHQVIIFDNFSAYPFDQLKTFGIDDAPVIKEDIRNKKEVEAAIQGCDRVVHLASLADVGATLRDPELNFYVDIDGSFNVLRACVKHQIKKLVFASSASVYGSPEWIHERPVKVKETDVVHPTTNYANTKFFNETQFRMYWEHYELPATSLRYFSVYGRPQIPKQGSHSWNVAIFTMQCMKKKPMTLFGDGKQIRDYTHVSEIAEATVQSLFEPRTDGKVFNIGTGIPTSVIDVATRIGKYFDGYKIVTKDKIKGDPLGCYAENSLMKELLGWAPKISFKEGLTDYIQWIQSHPEYIPEWL